MRPTYEQAIKWIAEVPDLRLTQKDLWAMSHLEWMVADLFNKNILTVRHDQLTAGYKLETKKKKARKK